MRELKFRVWNIKEKSYEDLMDVVGISPDCKYIYFKELDEPDTFYIETIKGNYIIEQFTGLYDRDGKEIYEGDIIQEEIDTGDDSLDGIHEYTVVWDEDCLCWGLKGSGFKNDLYEVNRTVEVVRNINEVRSY